MDDILTSQEVVSLVISVFADSLAFLLPVIAVMAAINWLIGFLIFATFGLERRTFGR